MSELPPQYRPEDTGDGTAPGAEEFWQGIDMGVQPGDWRRGDDAKTAPTQPTAEAVQPVKGPTTATEEDQFDIPAFDAEPPPYQHPPATNEGVGAPSEGDTIKGDETLYSPVPTAGPTTEDSTRQNPHRQLGADGLGANDEFYQPPQ